MPEFVSPGVFVDEIPRGPRPIEGVPTSTAAFLGETERGPVRPQLVTSFADYERAFGGTFLADRYMPHAVRGFFDNGGRRLYIARIVGAGANTASRIVDGLTVRASGPGTWGSRVWVRVLPSSVAEEATSFTLQLAYWREPNPPNFDPFDPANAALMPRPDVQRAIDGLSVDPQSPNYFASQITSPLISLARDEGTPWSVPAASPGVFLENGSDATAAPTATDYTDQGLAALDHDDFRDVALVYTPFPADDTSNSIAKLMISHCEQHRFRFAVIDSPNVDPIALDPRVAIADTQFAAYYAPWIVVSDPTSGGHVTVPPGGHVLGIYARVDITRGVHKAPANEDVTGALALAFAVTDAIQDVLNPRSVNAIRTFPGRGIRVWGARTMSSNGLWKYVTVRRLFICLERSIYEGLQWVVFEPNDEQLWARVRDTVRLFLRTQWRNGALLGRTEDEAFFITCDRTTMTQDDILNGRLICEIGIAPVRPAEFVIFRIGMWTVEHRGDP